jgi:hypothetical protein
MGQPYRCGLADVAILIIRAGAVLAIVAAAGIFFAVRS